MHSHVLYLTGVWTYTHTIRRPEINTQSVEIQMQVNARDYDVSTCTWKKRAKKVLIRTSMKLVHLNINFD